jgi:hypothetical protein
MTAGTKGDQILGARCQRNPKVGQVAFPFFICIRYPLSFETPGAIDCNPILLRSITFTIFILIIFVILSTLNLNYLFDYTMSGRKKERPSRWSGATQLKTMRDGKQKCPVLWATDLRTTKRLCFPLTFILSPRGEEEISLLPYREMERGEIRRRVGEFFTLSHDLKFVAID